MNRAQPQHGDLGSSEGLRAASGKVLAEAQRGIVERDPAVAVHEFRKAMKRWRAMLRLLEPAVGEEAKGLRTEARDLARELAGTRNVRAALDAVGDLRDSDETLSPRIRSTLKAQLEAIESNAEAAALTDDWRARLDGALKRAAATIRHWPLDDVGFAEIADALTASYTRARRALPEDWASAAPDALHRLRQRVVVQRYQMELMVPLPPKMGRAWVGEAQKLRDRLGRHQDLAVLKDLTAPRRPLARWRRRLAPLIEARQAEHRAAAARIARRLFAEKPKAFRRRLMSLWKSGHDGG
jgi:CHAD domain-containing protein